MNIHEGDTLKINKSKLNEKWETVLKNGFDVVLGNPPLSEGGISSHTGTMLGVKSETLWPLFTERSSGWLKASGFLAFINPLSWLKSTIRY